MVMALLWYIQILDKNSLSILSSFKLCWKVLFYRGSSWSLGSNEHVVFHSLKWPQYWSHNTHDDLSGTDILWLQKSYKDADRFPLSVYAAKDCQVMQEYDIMMLNPNSYGLYQYRIYRFYLSNLEASWKKREYRNWSMVSKYDFFFYSK